MVDFLEQAFQNDPHQNFRISIDGWKGLLTCYYFVPLQWKSQNRRFSQTNLHCCAAIPKRIAISQLRFQKIKLYEFLYIVFTFGEIRSSNPWVYSVKKDYFFRDTLKIGISRQISWNILDRLLLTLQIW